MFKVFVIGLPVLIVMAILATHSAIFRKMFFIPKPDILSDGVGFGELILRLILFLFIVIKVITYPFELLGISEDTALFISFCIIIAYWLYLWFSGAFRAIKTLSPIDKKKFNVQDQSVFSFDLRGRDKVVLNNPFRGIFIAGGAGSGKSKSLIEPIIHQAADKGFSGILYDFKFPTLAKEVQGSYKGDIKPYYVNFTDLSRTHQINPIDPIYLPNTIYAREAALTLLSNLDAKAVEKRDFWIQSGESLLTGVIVFLKNNYPHKCSFPHVVSLILDSPPKELLYLLSTDLEVKGIVSSLLSSIDSENTISGMFATLQNYLATLNTKEVFHVLSRSDFNLELNNPSSMAMLVLGNDDRISKSLSPVIALIVSAALKQMNQPERGKSVVILDEAPTLNIPNFSQLPATGRSNKIATVYSVQDISQMESMISKVESEKLIANLNSQFYGRTTNTNTADRVSKMFGDYDKEITSNTRSRSSSSDDLIKSNSSRGESRSVQLRKVLQLSEMMKLEVGQFACVLAESNINTGVVQFSSGTSQAEEIPVINSVSDIMLTDNFYKIKEEAAKILLSEDV